MADYAFVTTARFDAPQEHLFDALLGAEWLRAWRFVREVRQLQEGDADGVGGRLRVAVRGVAPYTLTFEVTTVAARRPAVAELQAAGDLTGTGRWNLVPVADGTEVTFHWTVSTTKPWMNAAAVVARPFFEWNHDAIMRPGMEALARTAGGELTAFDTGSEPRLRRRIRTLSALAVAVAAGWLWRARRRRARA